MDSQVKITAKNAAQDEQQQRLQPSVDDEVFGQGEMTDIVSDPLMKGTAAPAIPTSPTADVAPIKNFLLPGLGGDFGCILPF